MEVLLSVVASDLVGRLISFLIRKYQESGATADIATLQRALLRARVVVEEAEARQITNQAMLLQLNQLRGEMYRGSYALDTFRRRRLAVDPGRKRATASRSLGLPPGGDGTGGLSLSVMVEILEAAQSEMKEFVLLLGACPRLNRQPYSAYLFMETCMFGRQMEMEQIIGFLLQPAQDLDVLPVIGPHEVGKRTLVEHVCLDDRVREHFAKIHRLGSDDLNLQIHERHQGLIDAAQRSLIVIDLAGGDAGEEEMWRRFHSSVRRRAHRESKVILISRTERHSSLGTVPPLRLRAPRREELWYFFRALAFGAADLGERPELLRVAMALFASIHEPPLLASASIIAAALRADLSARSWRRVLDVLLGMTDECGVVLCRPVKGAPSVPCLFYDRRKPTGTARSELPKVTMPELLSGEAVPGEEARRFDVLVWRSRIPPYVSYVATCDMGRARQTVAAGEKRAHKRRRDQQDGHQRRRSTCAERPSTSRKFSSLQ